MSLARSRRSVKPRKIAAIGIIEQRGMEARLEDARTRFRKRWKLALYATAAEVIGLFALLNPVSAKALHERTTWSLILLVIFLAIHLSWMLIAMSCGIAWVARQKLENLDTAIYPPIAPAPARQKRR